MPVEKAFGEGKHQAEIWVGLMFPCRSPYSQSLSRRPEALRAGKQGSQAEPPTSAWSRHSVKVYWLDLETACIV